jgi:hypothetical protein
MPTIPQGPVFVALGDNALLGINERGQFIIRKEIGGKIEAEIELGYASEKRLDTMMLHMGSLRVFTDRNT